MEKIPLVNNINNRWKSYGHIDNKENLADFFLVFSPWSVIKKKKKISLDKYKVQYLQEAGEC